MHLKVTQAPRKDLQRGRNVYGKKFPPEALVKLPGNM